MRSSFSLFRFKNSSFLSFSKETCCSSFRKLPFQKGTLTFPLKDGLHEQRFLSTTYSSSSSTSASTKTLSKAAEEYRNLVLAPWKMKLFFLKNLPMAFLSNLNVIELSRDKCRVTVPYNYLTKNPFRSTYFACLAMAGELSTGTIAMMAIHKSNPPVSMLVTNLEAQYTKKADTITTFTCEEGEKIFEAVEQSKVTGQGQVAQVTTIGRNTKQEEVCRFKVSWSFKPKSQK